MASKYLNIKGTAYWARVFEENRDVEGFDGELREVGGQYTLMISPDDDSLRELTASGSQTVDYPKEVDTESGPVPVYKLKRIHEKYNRKGELLEWASGAPKVYGPDGKEWDIEEGGFIGNGSKVECRVCVYQAGRVVGTRLESVKILDLVEPPMKDVV